MDGNRVIYHCTVCKQILTIWQKNVNEHSAKKYVMLLEWNMGVSKTRDTPKWMVKIMENPIKKWIHLGGTKLMIFGNHPHD